MRILLSTLVLSLAAGVAFAADDDLDDAFEKDVLIIEASEFACYRFDVYLALSREQQLRGLMFVREMPAATGMLFVYDYVAVHSMWMKNTLIPLDVAFVRKDGVIIDIKAMQAHDLTPVGSSGNVLYAWEMNLGWFKENGISVGDTIQIQH